MTISSSAIKRNHDTGDATLNRLLDNMATAIQQGVTVTKVIASTTSGGGASSAVSTTNSGSSSDTSTELQIVARGITTFTQGDLIGVVDAKHVKAQSGVARAISVCTAPSTSGGTLYQVSHGLAWVKVESGVTVAFGDPAYLSAAEAGTCTNVQPSTGTQLLGMIQSAKSNGMAMVQLHIDLSGLFAS